MRCDRRPTSAGPSGRWAEVVTPVVVRGSPRGWEDGQRAKEMRSPGPERLQRVFLLNGWSGCGFLCRFGRQLSRRVFAALTGSSASPRPAPEAGTRSGRRNSETGSERQVVSQFEMAKTGRSSQKRLTGTAHGLHDAPAVLIRPLIERRPSMVDGIGHMCDHPQVDATRLREGE